MSYDSINKQIYWIDYGSHRGHKKKISINFAYDNGTIVKKNRILSSQNELEKFQPHAIIIDDFHRLLFWSDEATNVINIHNLDNLEQNIGQLLTSNNDKPRALALHSKFGLIFWVNIGSKITIERSKMDGNERKIVIVQDIKVNQIFVYILQIEL